MTHQPWLICNHIWHPARRLRLATTLIESTTPEVTEAASGGFGADTAAADVRRPLPPLSQLEALMSRPPQSGAAWLITDRAVRPRTDLSVAGLGRRCDCAGVYNWAGGRFKGGESINNQTKPEDVFLQHLGIPLQQIIQPSSGNSLPICM